MQGEDKYAPASPPSAPLTQGNGIFFPKFKKMKKQNTEVIFTLIEQQNNLSKIDYVQMVITLLLHWITYFIAAKIKWELRNFN